jgi:CHAT domain-containing protein/Tfp pilus assembly protein PilF
MPEYKERLNECNEWYGKGEYSKGLEIAGEVLRECRDAGVIANELAACLLIVKGHRALGEYEEAIQSNRQAGELAQSIPDWPTYLESLLDRGYLYLAIHKVKDAVSALDKGIGVDKEKNSGQMYPEFASAMADAYMKSGYYSKAEFMCHKAMMAIDGQSKEKSAKDKLAFFKDTIMNRTIAARKINLARAVEASKQYSRALYMLEGAAISDAKLEFDHIIAFHRGRIYLAQENLDMAGQALGKALKVAREKSDAAVEMLAAEQLGIAALKHQEYEKALSYFKDSIAILESGISKLRIEEFKFSFREMGKDVYAYALEAARALKDSETVWEFSERSRARTFLNFIGRGDLLKHSPRIAGYGREYTDISNRIVDLRKRIYEGYAGESGYFLAELKNQLKQLDQQKSAILRHILRDSPLDASLTDIPVVTARQFKECLDSQTCVAEYFVEDDGVNILLIDKNRLDNQRVTIKKNTLLQLVKGFLELIPQVSPARRDIKVQVKKSVFHGDKKPAIDDPRLETLSRELYRLLVKPFEDKLASFKRVCIIAHGLLQYLPFSALKEDEGRHLIEGIQVFYAPSASVLYYLLSAGPKDEMDKMVIFTGPETGVNAPDIPFAAEEVRRVSQMFPGVRRFSGEEAGLSAFLRETPAGDWIHLACHAHFNETDPLLSFLQLSPDQTMGHNGCLEVHQVYNLRLKAGLVILSACETAVSEISEGSEYVGLIRAFMTAGAASVIASLWPVDDEATAALMVAFYGNIREGQNILEALQSAQIDMIGNKRFQSPYFWSAFTLNGDWRASTKNL